MQMLQLLTQRDDFALVRRGRVRDICGDFGVGKSRGGTDDGFEESRASHLAVPADFHFAGEGQPIDTWIQ
jgi:hypothetical protein